MDCHRANRTSSVDVRTAAPRALLVLRGSPAPASAAREFSRRTFSAWGLPSGAEGPTRFGDLVLVVSELVTNAARHGGGAELLVLTAHGGDTIRVEVADSNRRLPAVRYPPAPAHPQGHGLPLVLRAADRVGVELRRDGPGKSVWAEFHRMPLGPTGSNGTEDRVTRP